MENKKQEEKIIDCQVNSDGIFEPVESDDSEADEDQDIRYPFGIPANKRNKAKKFDAVKPKVMAYIPEHIQDNFVEFQEGFDLGLEVIEGVASRFKRLKKVLK